MTDMVPSDESTPPPSDAPATPPVPPRRSPGHRGQDVRDTVAELAARAHEISLEAGSKMAGALKDVINAAAGVTTFALESARDLVQYFVRRGQMTQEEADKLLREAEEAGQKRGRITPRVEPAKKPAPPLIVRPPFQAPVVATSPAPAPPQTPAPKALAKPAPANKSVPTNKSVHAKAKTVATPPSAKKPAPKKPAPPAKATKKTTHKK